MIFQSTRGHADRLGFSQAIVQGLAPDGGLYVPLEWPTFSPEGLSGTTLTDIAREVLQPFLAGDPLAAQCAAIVSEAFDFPVRLRPVRRQGEGGSKRAVVHVARAVPCRWAV